MNRIRSFDPDHFESLAGFELEARLASMAAEPQSGPDATESPTIPGTLRGADLRKRDFRGADLRGAIFDGADLREATFRRADLREADLRDADISRARVKRLRKKGTGL